MRFQQPKQWQQWMLGRYRIDDSIQCANASLNMQKEDKATNDKETGRRLRCPHPSPSHDCIDEEFTKIVSSEIRRVTRVL